MILALAGCGPGTQKTGHLDDSGYHGAGTTGVTAAAGGIETGNAASLSANRTGTILFMTGPKGGKPARLISRTDSVTTAPTAKHLLQQAIASGHKVPVRTTSRSAPIVIEVDDHQETPIKLPAPATATPRTGSHITIQRQTQGAGQPTILKIMEAP